MPTAPEALHEIVRRRVKRLREGRGLTQEQLCERAGVSLDAVSRIEGGSRIPTLDTLQKLSAALGVSVEELLRSPPPAAPSPSVPLARVISLLEGQPAFVLAAVESIVKTVLKLRSEPTSDALESTGRRRPRKSRR